jgi:diaminopimelate epimerase
MLWSFAKYIGCGNDFAIFDNRKGLFPSQDFALIRQLCHRNWGIGADGIILLESSFPADFSMRIFNADGYEAEMCGNGLRCLAKFIQELGFCQPSYKIETLQRILSISHEGLQVCVEMGDPIDMHWNIDISDENEIHQVHYLNTGVPHVVLFKDQIERINLQQIGPYIRHHAVFNPNGTNVNLAQRLSGKEIQIRTFERGIEGETLACGTGATAVALAAAYCYQFESPVHIRTSSKDILKIGFHLKDQIFSQVTLTGPAHCTYRGEVHLLEKSCGNTAFSIDCK